MKTKGRFGLLTAGLAFCWLEASAGGGAPRFYADDPLGREPETQDASNVRRWDVSDEYELFQNSISSPGEQIDVRAMNVNTADEVPSSSWFTDRLRGPGAQIVDSLQRVAGPAPGPWTIVEGKPEGIQPGFVATDSTGHRFFVKFDPPSNPEMASGAEVISTRIFGAFGYNVPENSLARVRPEALLIGEQATVVRHGRVYRFTKRDLEEILRRAPRSDDGSYRLLASKEIPGRSVGPFRYYGTRPDDPNDIVLHEHRRELRGLRVLAAWLNHHDVKSSNSLDTVVGAGGRQLVRHHLLDFGATLGSGSIEAQKRRAGNEYVWEARPTLITMLTFGLYVRPWIKIDYPDIPAVGRIEGDYFDPARWKPDFPNPAFENARGDDTFWAASRVAAFSDDVIRAIVKTAEFSDPRATEYLTAVMIKRRDKVLGHWLTDVNPVVGFALDGTGALTFRNMAVDAHVAATPSEYVVRWAKFDNGNGSPETFSAEVRAPEPRFQAPAPLLMSAEYVTAEIWAADAAHPQWSRPVRVCFRRHASGWTTVGVDRMPSQ
ncbi:MAG: hypothetical protein ACRD09_12080 [Vicinamibacterales bacterium]